MPFVDFYPLLLQTERSLPREEKDTLRAARQPLRVRIRRGSLDPETLSSTHREWAVEFKADWLKRKRFYRDAGKAVGKLVDLLLEGEAGHVLDTQAEALERKLGIPSRVLVQEARDQVDRLHAALDREADSGDR